MSSYAQSRPYARRLLLVTVLLLAALALMACGGTSAPVASEPVVEEPVAEDVAATATPMPEAEGATDVEPVPVPEGMPEDPQARNGMYTAPPEMTIDPAKFYYATVSTEKGDILVQLFADRAPTTVNNFVFLANAGYYNNTTFHRVIDGFMAQAGDPTGTGAGGPGYEFEDEFFPGLGFDRPGLLAMANRGPATNGSQFFVTLAPTEWLNGAHTIFGEVIEGADVLDDITRRDPQQAPDFEGDLIQSVTIEERDSSVLPTPSPSPPTATPTPTPTPFAPSDVDGSADGSNRLLADLPAPDRIAYFNVEPALVIDTELTYQAVISTTQGELTMDLFVDKAPLAVNNFVLLANLGLFDGTPVNQVTPGEALIFGALDNTPTGDAGYLLNSETPTDVDLVKGVVSYIPLQIQPPDPTVSSSSIILVALGEVPQDVLGLYGFFGQISAGLDVLDLLTITDQIVSVTIVAE